jgi:hypothetical protein
MNNFDEVVRSAERQEKTKGACDRKVALIYG